MGTARGVGVLSSWAGMIRCSSDIGPIRRPSLPLFSLVPDGDKISTTYKDPSASLLAPQENQFLTQFLEIQFRIPAES